MVDHPKYRCHEKKVSYNRGSVYLDDTFLGSCRPEICRPVFSKNAKNGQKPTEYIKVSYYPI